MLTDKDVRIARIQAFFGAALLLSGLVIPVTQGRLEQYRLSPDGLLQTMPAQHMVWQNLWQVGNGTERMILAVALISMVLAAAKMFKWLYIVGGGATVAVILVIYSVWSRLDAPVPYDAFATPMVWQYVPVPEALSVFWMVSLPGPALLLAAAFKGAPVGTLQAAPIATHHSRTP